MGSGGPQVNKSGISLRRTIFLIERESVNKQYSGTLSSFLSETSKYRIQSDVTDWQNLCFSIRNLTENKNTVLERK